VNSLIQKFYALDGEQLYKEVIFLNDAPVSWEEISKRAPDLPRAWFELSRISKEDRLEFSREFWLDRFPYHPSAHPLFFEFFEELDDIVVVLARKGEEPHLKAELLYSIRDSSCFFRGLPPCKEEDLESLFEEVGYVLPRDYCSFMKIHNGFGKRSEMGLLKTQEIPEARKRVMDLILEAPEPVKSGSAMIDPVSLIPFFEELGLGSFQCFYSDWYPGSEMGNVYLSGIDYIISDIDDKKMWQENLAFPTFMDWFVCYLQGSYIT
jgi:hypothetical protein